MFERVAGELRAKLLSGVRAWPGYESTRHTSATWCHWRGGRRRDLPRCRWAVAGPGGASHSALAPLVWRAPEGPEGTGGLRDRPLRAAGSRVAISRAAGPSGARNTRGATSNANARQPERAAARSRSQWSTQRSRAATTSATWTAFRAAPLRRLSPETTRTRPRLPSTAWS